MAKHSFKSEEEAFCQDETMKLGTEEEAISTQMDNLRHCIQNQAVFIKCVISDTTNRITEIETSDKVDVTSLENQVKSISSGLKDFCRICASLSTDLIPLFLENGLDLELTEKINGCLPIRVSVEDRLPKQICSSCSSKLDVCHQLINTCLEADLKLQKLFSSQELLETESVDFADTSLKENPPVTTVIKSVEEDNVLIQSSVKNENSPLPCDADNFSQLPEQTNSLSEAPSPKTDENRSENCLAVEKEWSCKSCDYKASRKSSLILHERQMHGSKSSLKKNIKKGILVPKTSNALKPTSYTCKYCDKSFVTILRCKKHERSHTRLAMQSKDQLEVCQICDEKFVNVKELREHRKVVHGIENVNVKVYSCDQCGKCYNLRGSLDIHKATHSKETPFLCDLCGKSFKHVSNLRCHKRSHAEDHVKCRHSCDMCPKSFPSKFHLKEHQNVHLDIKPYSCSECGKEFHRRLQLRQHRSAHSTENSFECPQCGVKFNRRGNMTQHMKRHLQDKKFICKLCKTSFPTLSEVMKHRRTHTELESVNSSKEESISCVLCRKSFSDQAKFDAHTKTNCLVQCPMCDKKLSNNRTLKYHMRSFHTGERPFPCEFCSESFLSREARIVHQRIHTGEKPYVCSVCNMSFRCASNLAQHSKSHTDERPWACDQCPKSFKRKGILLVHMRTHTGERPFCCDTCGRRFSQKNDMLKHQSTHNSPAQTFTCQTCGWIFHSRRELNKHIQSHTAINEIVERVAEVTTPKTQAVVMTAEDIGNFPITLVGNNIIVHNINEEDTLETVQTLPQAQILQLSDPLLQTGASGQQVLMQTSPNHVVHLAEGTIRTVVLQHDAL